MPLGIERINVRTAQPNPNINFIRTRNGPDKEKAQDLLERVAAICVPIMKRNHIYVMALEEFPYNTEFLGRNFNAGELIQLVLKNKNGGWLPFKFVQRVLMHELAHCKQMNHSKNFWQVNNQHCAELKVLWEKGYTGEGMWSRGLSLATGNNVHDRPLIEGDIPEHLCGGTFRSNRKRKRSAPEKEKISYQERQQRKIAKKFGTNGVALGADDEIKAKLEKGKRPAGKPRVAGSARGRELRAAAALARFEKPQGPSDNAFGNFEVSDDSESDEDDVKIKPDDARDTDGQRIVDSNGRGMIKVCEIDDGDADAQKEMEELRNLDFVYGGQKESKKETPMAGPRKQSFGGRQAIRKTTLKTYSVDNSDEDMEDLRGLDYVSGGQKVSKRGWSSDEDMEDMRGLDYVSGGQKGPKKGGSIAKGVGRDQETHKKTFKAYPVYESENGDSLYGTAYPAKSRQRVLPIKQEVFDILTDYLGDATCNPEGAIYSGLDAARASKPVQESQSAKEAAESLNDATRGQDRAHLRDYGISGNRRMESHQMTSMHRVEREHKGIRKPDLSSRPNAANELKPIRSRSYSSNNGRLPSPRELNLMNNSSATYSGSQIKSGKSNSSHFARAVEKRHRAETGIGLPPSPELSPKGNNAQANTRKPLTDGHARPPSSISDHSASQRVPSAQVLPLVPKPPSTQAPQPRPAPVAREPAIAPAPAPPAPVVAASGDCAICTTVNDVGSLTCMVCSNVLHPDRDPFHWRCESAVCKGTEYVNSGDYGICGVCGEKKSLQN